MIVCKDNCPLCKKGLDLNLEKGRFKKGDEVKLAEGFVLKRNDQPFPYKKLTLAVISYSMNGCYVYNEDGEESEVFNPKHLRRVKEYEEEMSDVWI